MKSLYESLLSDIEDTLKSGDVTVDEMCKLNYRMFYHKTINSKAVRGGRSILFKKYFNKKLEPIEVSMYEPYARRTEVARKIKRKYNTPITYFEALVLNTAYDEPIDDALKCRVICPYKIIDDKLEYEINSRLLPEYRKLYEEGKPIFKTHTRWIHRPQRTEVIIQIWLTSNVLSVDMDADYGKICEIEFIYYEDDKKSI
jgi:hypothetical protein